MAPSPTVPDSRFRELVEQVTDYAIFFLDREGHVASWNRGAARIKGYLPEEIIGRHFSVFYRPEDIWKCEHELKVASEVGRVEDEGWRVRKDGSLFWANVVITGVRDEHGQVVGFAKVTRDVTERRQVDEQLRLSEERFRLMVEGVRDYAIFMLDPLGRVATWNSGAESINGYAASEILGQHFSRFYPQSDVLAGKCERELEIATSAGKFEEEGWRVRSDGSQFWANVLITAIRNASGQTVGFAKITRDLTERRVAELERARVAERSRQRLNDLASLAEGLATATNLEQVARVIVEEGRVFAQADICTLHLRSAREATLELIGERGANPEIVRQIQVIRRDSGNPFFAVGMGDAPSIWVESDTGYAAVAPDIREISARGPRAKAFACVPLVADGQTIGMLGIGYLEPRRFSPNEREFIGTVARQCAQAVSRTLALRAEREAALLAERLRSSLSTTLRSIGDGVIATDNKGRVTLMNDVAEQLTGWPEHEALGHLLSDVFRIVNEHTREVVTNPVDKVLETGGIVGLANHTVLLARDGRELPIDDSGAPIRTEGGPIDGVVLVFRDVTERKREESRRNFLADATTTLTQSLDYETTVAQVARLLVPGIADWCAVDLVVEGELLPHRLAVAHVDPAKVELAQQFMAQYPPRPDDATGVMQVLRSGQPELYSEITDAMLVATAVDEEWLRLARQLSLRSALIVPLSVRGRVIGAISLVFAESGRQYEERDLAFADDLARRCSNAIDNARLYQAEQGARRDADLANRSKDEFLAVVSHELRTPLNAILGWSKLLMRSEFDEARRLSAIQTVERNAVAMTRLIEDLLDMSRVVSGKLRLNVQRVVLPQIIEAAVESVRPSATAKGVTLRLELEPSAPDMVGDPTRLEQIVWNLLSNAVKFTPRGGTVDVTLRQQGKSLEISVADTGRGIEPDFLTQVFDPFRQAGEAHAASRGGLGLGLAITKQLVELHGGRIHVVSEGVGKGAVFTVVFALLDEPDASAPQPLVAAEEAPATQPRFDGLRVLIVEDDDDARELLQSILVAAGCSVTSAAGVDDALATFAANRPDVLLSDVNMPGRDGYALIREIRALPRERGGDVPAAAITAHARQEDRSRLLNAGFSIHLPKPIDPGELMAVLSTLTRFLHRRTTPVHGPGSES